MALLLHALLTLLPLTAGAFYALLYSIGLAGTLSEGFTWRYWQSLIERGTLMQTFLYSAYIMAASIIPAYGAALALIISNRGRIARSAAARIFFIPLAIPALVLAFFAFRFLSGSGWLAALALHLGWIGEPADFPHLVNDPMGIGIIFVHFILAFAFFVLFTGQIYQNEKINDHLSSAATLGAGRAAAIRRVALPLLLRRSGPTLVLYSLFVFGSYEVPLLLGRSNPEMLSVRVVRMLGKFNLGDRPEGFALAFAYIFVSILLISILKIKNNPQR